MYPVRCARTARAQRSSRSRQPPCAPPSRISSGASPRLYRNVCDETGAVRRHLNVFVNSDNVRDLDGVDTTLTPGDVVTILPAVSGG